MADQKPQATTQNPEAKKADGKADSWVSKHKVPLIIGGIAIALVIFFLIRRNSSSTTATTANTAYTTYPTSTAYSTYQQPNPTEYFTSSTSPVSATSPTSSTTTSSTTSGGSGSKTSGLVNGIAPGQPIHNAASKVALGQAVVDVQHGAKTWVKGHYGPNGIYHAGHWSGSGTVPQPKKLSTKPPKNT